jgi:hypothetical protein
MKIIGKINVGGVDTYQASSIPKNIDLDAKVGSYLYSDPLNVFEKQKKGWFKTTFRIMFMNILTWAITVLNSDEKTRQVLVSKVFDSVEHFNEEEREEIRVKMSKTGSEREREKLQIQLDELEVEGRSLVADLKENYTVVGFSTAIVYLSGKERGEGDLDCFWEHPFSMPTIVLKHNRYPLIISTNGNINLNDSRLLKLANLSELQLDDVLEGDYEFEDKKEKLTGFTG